MANIQEAAGWLHGQAIDTGGDGWWSRAKRTTRIKKVEVYRDGRETFLKVYPDRKTWRGEDHGLIYTDSKWLRGLRSALGRAGYHSPSKVYYTEQGMQGRDYVHLIVGHRW